MVNNWKLKLAVCCLFFLASTCVVNNTARAAVRGMCSNCHTMHNSQNGASLLSSAQNNLLVDDCVGCHSSSGPDTIVTLGNTRIPIVYNTTAYPSEPLAGGNFYKVGLGGAANDVYGHNVLGISGVDENLSAAPGDWNGCASSCHVSLAIPTQSVAFGTGGCKACHQSVKHHGKDPQPGFPETEESGWYRYLSGHGFSGTSPDPNFYVYGIEDEDWEQDQNPESAQHNWYGEQNFPSTSLVDFSQIHTMTYFCRGCHKEFHASTGKESPFLRHPSAISLPATGEYAGYDPLNNYSKDVPVGWSNPVDPASGEPIVMCLSCHRAHGSEHPDMLRWDYDSMNAHGGANSNGCFKCHSLKDE